MFHALPFQVWKCNSIQYKGVCLKKFLSFAQMLSLRSRPIPVIVQIFWNRTNDFPLDFRPFKTLYCTVAGDFYGIMLHTHHVQFFQTLLKHTVTHRWFLYQTEWHFHTWNDEHMKHKIKFCLLHTNAVKIWDHLKRWPYQQIA